MSTKAPNEGLSPEQKRALLARLLKERATGSSEVALSYNERALWFLHAIAPEHSAYNVSFALRVRSSPDPNALRRAMAAVVSRHVILRTRYVPAALGPARRVLDQPEFGFAHVQLGPVNETELQRRVEEAHRQPFDLEHGPLFRASLFSLGAQDHVLLFSLHHIVCDGWSMWQLLDEIRRLYAAEVRGRDAGLGPPPAQYTDFVRWQSALLAGPDGKRLEEYWSRQLAGELPVLELPTKVAPDPGSEAVGASLVFEMEAALAERVRALGRSQSSTLFVVLLAAYQALLHRFSGQEDVLVGSPTFGRNRSDFETTVGLFMNPVVLRARVSGDSSFLDLLSRARETTVGALGHQDYPFHLMAERHWPRRGLSVHPLFQAEFILQKPQQSSELFVLFSSDNVGRRVDFAGLEVEAFPLPQQEAQVGLTLEVADSPGAMPAHFKYDARVFERATIERLRYAYEAILRAGVENPSVLVGDLPVLEEADRQRVLVQWSGAGEAGTAPPSALAHEAFERQAERAPEATALVWEDGSLSYAELNRRANRLAHHLVDRQVGAGEVVGVCLPRSADLIVALLAVAKTGAAYLPLETAYPPSRLAALLEDARVRLVLTVEGLAEALSGSRAEALCVDSLSRTLARANDSNLPRRAEPQDLAYLVYTSGSTGGPKGVMIERRSLGAYTATAAREFGLAPHDRVLQFATATFDTSAEEIYPCLASGATLVLRSDAMSRSIEEFVGRCTAWGVTVVDLPTAFWHELVSAIASGTAALPPELRLVIVGGERALPERVAQWARIAPSTVRLLNTYGPTEATIVATWGDLVRDGRPLEDAPIGRPISGAQAYVLDARGRPVPPGVVGELHLGGAGLARGYLGQPTLTAERFVPKPYGRGDGARLYRTGDLVRHAPDGSLLFVGRLGHQVKIRGFRVELEEIERALRAHSAVADAVVTAPAAASGLRTLVAYVVPKGMTMPVQSELRTFLAAQLPDYMLPGAYVVLSALPKTSSGKIDRRALPAPSGPDLERVSTPPRDPVEELLCGIWTDVLGVASVSVHDDFFELGGDSIKSIQVITRAAAAGLHVSAEQVFRHRSVAALATAVRGPAAQEEDSEPIRVEAPSPRRKLSASQRRLWFFDRLEPGSSAYNIGFHLVLEGTVDVPALGRSLDTVVARHEALRTRFSEVGGEPYGTVDEPSSVPLPTVDLRGEPTAEAEAARLVEEAANAPFDLQQGPLLRALLVHISADRHVLGLTLHHIVSDGWSIGVFTFELLEAYEAAVQGREPGLPPLPFQYGDYAAWEERWLESGAAKRQLGYWKERLAGPLPVVDLPADFARPKVQTFRGGMQQRRLSTDLSRRVADLGRKQGATPFMTLLAAFSFVLHRLTGLEDLSVGVPVAGRNRDGTERLVGVFINTVVIRHDFRGDSSFTELLQRTRTLALEAYRNADLPFDRVVEALNPRRDPGRTPLFQVLVNSLDFSGRSRTELSSLAVEFRGEAVALSKFDLTLYLGNDQGAILMGLSYNADLFRAARMEEMLSQVEHVLDAVTRSPDRPLSELSLITAPARALLPDPLDPLGRGTGTAIARAPGAWVAGQPGRTAVSDPRGSLDYGTLDRLSAGLAHRLRVAGIGRGDVVALRCARTAELVWGLHGVLRSGAAFVVLDAAHPPARIAACLRAAAPRAWLESPGLPDPGPEVAALVNRPGWALQSSLDPALFDGAGGGVAETLDGPAGDDLAYVAFTSGTTGGVKGIVGTHGPLTHFLDWHVRTFELTPDDRFSMLSGLSHDPLLRDVFTPACLGASLHVPDPNDILAPARLREWMNREAITVAHLTPSLARVLTEGSAAGELPHLRYVFFGGDVLTRDVVRRLRRSAPGARIVSFYGATETPQAMAWHVVPDESEDAPLPSQMPLGRGIDDVQVLVLGPGGRLAGIGEAGEIVVRTPHLARGYLDDEALSRERFVVSPFSAHPQDRLYRTGDLGRFRLDGSVDFVGRRDGQVKIRGFRVELEGVEQVLRDHPAVRHAAVLCSREGGDGEADSRLVAYVAHDAGQQATVTELRDYMRTRLPDYLVPSFFVAMDALPLTPNGKVDRRALEEVSFERTRQEDSYLPPRTEMERFVAEVWSQLLGVGQVGIQDNFFDLGGHSLLAVRALSRIEARVGRRLNPREMIYQSLEQFARGLALPEEPAQGVPAVPKSGIADRLRRWVGGRGGGSDAPAA